MILHLRRKAEINIRIFVQSRSSPPMNMERIIREFITQIRCGMTVTRLPRPITGYIRHKVTLVADESEFGYWKDRLSCVGHDVEREKATEDNWDLECQG